MKSTRRQDYVSKRDIFRDFMNRASIRHYKSAMAKERKLQNEVLADRQAEDNEK